MMTFLILSHYIHAITSLALSCDVMLLGSSLSFHMTHVSNVLLFIIFFLFHISFILFHFLFYFILVCLFYLSLNLFHTPLCLLFFPLESLFLKSIPASQIRMNESLFYKYPRRGTFLRKK